MVGTINKLGVVGTVMSTVVCLGCCVSVLGPLAGVLFAGGLLDRVPVDWQLPLLYGFLALAFVGFGLGWRRHRRLSPVLLFLPGGAAILYPFHEALDVWVLQLLIWLGLGLLLAAAAWDTVLAFRARGCRLPLPPLEVSQ
ncbi:MAG: MerC domain-containing protein [Candidatus Methylomirabilia bacterium]